MKKPSLNKRNLARRIRRLAVQMHRLGITMDYHGGFGPIGEHGRELIGAAAIAKSWARKIERDN